MPKAWNTLVVDDEPDVHKVSSIALRRRMWCGRPFTLVSAMSAAEARKILADPASPAFHVALVDVVMETPKAGLELCEFIRATQPVSLRIILRTGQPGMAAEEDVLNNYDIDYYLTKAELTEDKLYAALRASCRSSFDVSTSLALERQLREFTTALQRPETESDDVLRIMEKSVAFLEDKHDVAAVFIDDLDAVVAGKVSPVVAESAKQRGLDLAKLVPVLAKAHESGTPGLRRGVDLGLGASDLFLPVSALEQPKVATTGVGRKFKSALRAMLGVDRVGERPQGVRGGFCISVAARPLSTKEERDLTRDLTMFAENWRIVYAMLHLREVTVRERVVMLEASSQMGNIAG